MYIYYSILKRYIQDVPRINNNNMADSIKKNLESVKKIYMSDASLSMLCDFERVLDNMDFYAFPNWRLGELVEGPEISRYWVKCTFMWPLDRMPDPAAANRLLPYGAKISYKKDVVKKLKKAESGLPFYKQGGNKMRH